MAFGMTGEYLGAEHTAQKSYIWTNCERALTLTIGIMASERPLERMFDKLNRHFAAQAGALHASHAGHRLFHGHALHHQ